jgi:8-oxo-dGTP diphosphatase
MNYTVNELTGKLISKLTNKGQSMEPEINRPKVGVGIIVRKGKKFLLGKRGNSHGYGEWCFCGGHLEFGETIENCAKREVFEESGVRIKNLKVAFVTNDIFKKEKRHYITIFVKAEYSSGILKIKEPEKMQKLEWFLKKDIPSPLFLPIRNSIKKGYKIFE